MKNITRFFVLFLLLSFTQFMQAQAPVLSGNSIINYLENSGPQFINPNIVLTDPDSATMSEAHVDSDPFESYERTTLISNPATMGDIYGESYIDEGWFDVFSTSNTATLDQWQQALRSVTYTNDSDDPAATTRLYTFSIIDDQGEYSNTIVVPINIIPVNDPPVRIAGSTNGLTVTEESPATSLGLSGVDYNPIEAAQTMSFIPTHIPSADFGSIILADGSTIVTGASYTLSELRGMRFQPAINAKGMTTFSYAATDNGGTDNGGVDSITENILITINGVTETPTITGSYCTGVTTVTGTSPDDDGTLITVYSGSTSIGTATVSGGIWTATVTALTADAVLTATAWATGESISASSAAVGITLQQWYLDADGDHYYTGSVVMACASPGAGYTMTVTGSNDCDDANDAAFPGASEICWNGILENCSGTLSQGCASVVVNMTQSYHNTNLQSLSTAIPAVSYNYPGASNIKYRFSITNLATGITATDIIQASRYVTIPVAIHSYNASYSIKASAVINEEIVPFAGNTITVLSPAVQLITLNSVNCGVTLPTLATTISANAGLNATGYTFRIRLNNGDAPSYFYSQSATRFISANSFTGFPLQYSSSYKVAVQYTFNDPVTGLPMQSGYGTECTVNTPSVPSIALTSPVCGSRVTTMNANVTAASGYYATGYQFRIRLFSDSGTPTYYTTAINQSRFSSLAAFQGITLSYNTDYAISVRYSVFNDGLTVWSGYGPECKITTPFFPTTSLVPSQCGTGSPTALNHQLSITPYPGNPNYRVLLEELDGENVTNSQEITVVVPSFRLSDFSIAQQGKNYSVSVAIKQNGVFGNYSTGCDVFTSTNGNGDDEGGVIVKTTIPFKATAYPNPFTNNFTLDLKSSSQSSANIMVYDMIGRLIEKKEASVSDIESTTIGDKYPSGVYNVVVSQNDNAQTVRVVKR